MESTSSDARNSDTSLNENREGTEATDDPSSDPLPEEDVEALQQEAYAVLKRDQEQYSARQNRLACAFMVTNPDKARSLHPEDSPLTWEEFVDPLLASCWEWIEGKSEAELEALVIFENEFMPAIYKTCDFYDRNGKRALGSLIDEWINGTSNPASLAPEIVKRAGGWGK